MMSYLYNYFVLETCWKASCKQIISPRYYKVMNLQDDLVMNPVYKSFDILLGLCVHPYSPQSPHFRCFSKTSQYRALCVNPIFHIPSNLVSIKATQTLNNLTL